MDTDAQSEEMYARQEVAGDRIILRLYKRKGWNTDEISMQLGRSIMALAALLPEGVEKHVLLLEGEKYLCGE